MSRRANLFRLMLSLVKTITILVVIGMIGSTLFSPPSTTPMTSTKRIETICVENEITSLINDNLKRLNKDKKDVQLERKIEAYIVKDNKKGLKKETCEKIAKNIVAHSKFPIITTSIIFVESSYNKKAVNKHSGATGLGQIHPIHEDELREAGIIKSFNELKNIEPNIKAIEFVLNQKLEITDGNMNEALKLYSGNAYEYDKKIWNKVEEIRKYIKTT